MRLLSKTNPKSQKSTLANNGEIEYPFVLSLSLLIQTMQTVERQSVLLDNSRPYHSVGKFLSDHLSEEVRLSVVSAYFTIFAYEKLQASLNNVQHVDFLFGEPQFISRTGQELGQKAFILDANGLQLANVLEQKQLARQCAEWIRNKVTIKSVTRSNFLHGKMYHIANGSSSHAVMGSSNFTVRGLGLAEKQNNLELNMAVESEAARAELKAWFDKIWNDTTNVEDVTEKVLQYLAQVYANNPPEFIYFKTLFHLFEQYLNDWENNKFDLGRTTLLETKVWSTLFEFQRDGVKGAINRLTRFNGCILADSVGLGKTYSALAVIKYFELKNERVLVLSPKKLRENWTVYRRNDRLNPFVEDRFRYDVVTHTDLSRETGMSGDINLETLNWGNYDLIVIDESHNFRNNTPGKKDETGAIIRRSRYTRLMEDIIKSGINTKVLLLSATPVNNDLLDLRNQLRLITGNRDDAFAENIGVSNITDTLSQAQKRFKEWTKSNERANTNALMAILGSDFFKLLDELTIARARRHIQKYYVKEMARIGQFPKRLPPIPHTPRIDLQREFASYDTISDTIDGYTLSLYSPSRFVMPEYQHLYNRREGKEGNFTQEQRERFLIGMMKVNFLKRLESSIHSFTTTLKRTKDKIEALELRLSNFQAAQRAFPEIDWETIRPEDLDDEDQELVEIGQKLVYRTAHLDIEAWLKALRQDRRQLETLYDQAVKVTPERDEKMAGLKRLIEQKVTNPPLDKNQQPNRKIIVFTAFADTANYLYDHLAEWAKATFKIESALVVGSGSNHTTFQPEGMARSTEFNNILINFAPRAKNRQLMDKFPQQGEIDLLIATDCISEGQNLQDCDYLVNYDIHWNPVRIIQRFGRIDRIGSTNEAVQLVNFWPTPNLDKYIDLKTRVEARMALVDIAATNEDNLLAQQDIEEIVKEDLKYRDQQLRRLQTEVIDLEELEDTVDLTDFTLDDFRLELLRYLDANRDRLEGAPLGMYTVVPPSAALPHAKPGVLFCLRQKQSTASATPASQGNLNPLQPYYLLYVHEDGTVRYTYAQPKQCLSLLRELCAGQAEAYDELCQSFDTRTQDGRNMSHYDRLMQNALKSIRQTFGQKVGAELQSNKGFLIPPKSQQPSTATEWDLVTWVVILTKEG